MEAASELGFSVYTFAIRLVFEKCDIWSGLIPRNERIFLGNTNNFLQWSPKLSCSGGKLGSFLNLLQAQLGPAINVGEIHSEKESVSNQIYLGENSACFFLEEAILLSWAVSELLICNIGPVCLCTWTAVKSVLSCLTVKHLGAVLITNCPQNQRLSVFIMMVFINCFLVVKAFK